MLSPVEAVGLRGKQIDGRLRRAANRLSSATLAQFERRLRDDAWRNHVIYERDGVAEPVRIMLRPLAATQDQIAYVHHVCSVLTDALRRLGDLYLADADVRRVLALDATEAAWLSEVWSERHGRNNPIYGRLDAVCDFSSAQWRDGLAFLEPNLSGIGGIHYGPVVEQLVMRDVVPEMQRFDPALRVQLPRDQRELFMQSLLEHAESIGRNLRTLAFVEPKYERSGPDEQRVLATFIENKYGVAVVHADPRELRVERGEVVANGRIVDLAYRDYEVRDLIAAERTDGVDVAPMRRLFAENRIVSSIAGDFDHKSCWELLTDEALAARHFSPEERRLFDKHVLWTRLVRPGRILTWDRRDVDLVEFALAHREALVLKPNRSFGGTGVYLGASVDDETWRGYVTAALAGADDPHGQWVLQRAAPIPVFDFPCADANGLFAEESFYTVMGFAATDHGLGVLCRVSQRQVVNVAQRGGVAAVLVADEAETMSRVRGGIRVHSSGARETFRAKLATIRDLDAVIGLLGWDEETYLPVRGHAQRGDQFATLESIRHRLMLDPELYAVAVELTETAASDRQLRRELDLYFRAQRIASALPDTLVREFARVRSQALAAWETARAERTYSRFAGPFTELLALVRERGQALCGGDPYDGLLDEHEAGLKRAELEPILRTLSTELRPLIAHAAERSRRESIGPISLDVERQRVLVEALLRRMGFDFARGRLDDSTHPFTLAAGSHDVRLTVRYDPDNALTAVFAALHEGGHGLYDQGFGDELAGTSLADAPSIGMHESQSRLWENHVGRSASFWHGFLTIARDLIGSSLDEFDASRMYRLVNRVVPGTNRVAADELTYNLHIVMRTELELLLLGGQLGPIDLPEVWREKSLQFFGVAPPDDVVGCLQDVHWALGSFGYFPTYTLGNLYAATLWERLCRDVPTVDHALACGDLSPVSDWLRREVHVHGARETTAELLTRVSGQPPSAASFLAHVRAKYSDD